MKSDILIRNEGMKILRERLGLVEAERFINLVNKDNIDYTEWQKELWDKETIGSLLEKAQKLPEGND